jgi:hypothetical protein
MQNKRRDWWCPICEFTIWGSKPKCRKCGYINPLQPSPTSDKKQVIEPPSDIRPVIEYWVPGNSDPKWDKFGPYSILKGGYDGTALENEPANLKHPNCGCIHLQYCPRRHHNNECRCYTCRCKTHKW